jgi:tetratricopeptide (TPR) repeat protein
MARLAFLLMALLVASSTGLYASGSSSQSAPAPAAKPSLEEQAVLDYNKGLKHRDKAWEFEAKAAKAAKEKDHDKNLKKAQKEYGKVIEQQLEAVKKNAKFHEAYSSLGYAYRKTGEYDKALESYDKALTLQPNYVEAIEYRGEAYLGLNRLTEAQKALEVLIGKNPKYAVDLLGSMKQWLKANKDKELDGIGAEMVEAFGAWVAEKEALVEKQGIRLKEAEKAW